MRANRILHLCLLFLPTFLFAQPADPFKPDSRPAASMASMELVWQDEFNVDGKPDPANWTFEHGFARNQELQWYQPDNATCVGGALVITGKRERVKNERYVTGSPDWRLNREYANYTSASLQTRGLHQWQFGRFEIRARIDTVKGAWPAIWTLGVNGRWPANGEIDIMEFYRIKSVPTILGNIAWGSATAQSGTWDDAKIPLTHFMANDGEWAKKFHTWRMDWTKDSITLLLDDEVINTTALNQTINPDGSNPFLKPHYLLLNLALGGNGDDPTQTKFPVKYEVDYVRVYQLNNQQPSTASH